MPDIDKVWKRIRHHEGERFETKRGKPLKYEVTGNVLTTDRAEQNLSKGEFAKALARVPITGPGKINNLVRGPSYIYAILHDSRIRQADW